MKCKNCGGKNVEILRRDIVFGNFYDVLCYCPDCDEGWEERIWVIGEERQ